MELGDRVKDRISGVAGILIGITDWLYGCRRVTIQPEEAKDGKPADMLTVDEPQIVVLEKGVQQAQPSPAPKSTPKHTGGPRPTAHRRSDPDRR